MEKQPNFSMYELDRDIPIKQWNDYMKKYSNDFMIDCSDERIKGIRCKYGKIEPYSLIKGYLAFVGDFPTPQKKAYFKRLISQKEVEITHEGYTDIIVKFSEKALQFLSDFFKCKRRMKLSKQERERRAKLLEEVRSRKKVMNNYESHTLDIKPFKRCKVCRKKIDAVEEICGYCGEKQ